jgi:hypothetical protein
MGRCAGSSWDEGARYETLMSSLSSNETLILIQRTVRVVKLPCSTCFLQLAECAGPRNLTGWEATSRPTPAAHDYVQYAASPMHYSHFLEGAPRHAMLRELGDTVHTLYLYGVYYVSLNTYDIEGSTHTTSRGLCTTLPTVA